MLKGRVVTAGMARAKRPAGWAASRDTPRRRDDFEFDDGDDIFSLEALEDLDFDDNKKGTIGWDDAEQLGIIKDS